MSLRSKVIYSIFKRNFAGYFSGVLGYLFIVVFVVVGGALAFNGRFFTANEPNLDQLTSYFPVLLLFFIPALTMGVWSEEKRSGTDELLFTLPASEPEVLLGKFLSVLAVYTVALAFSLTHVFVLMFLGNPDFGLLFTTYAGYWIAGASLLSAGMLASITTTNMTVAFVLGIVFCAVPVFVGEVARMIGAGDWAAELGLQEQFRDFGMGVVPLQSCLYFLALTAFMLYLNFVWMSRRHWSAGNQPRPALQFAVRACSIAVALGCATAWAGYAAVRIDATSERLFSLSGATKETLADLESQRPIEIQAFISPDVPPEYLETKKRLTGLLRQFDELGGNALDVRFVDVEPYSEQADEAKFFGIEPVRLVTEKDGRRKDVDVYLGAVVISSYDKVVVPFFGKGLPIEYELTRSVRTVADESRRTVGILTTDAGLMSGTNNWQIVEELKKQYQVEQVSADVEIDAKQFDVLLAAMPSSLTDGQMDHLVKYAESGNPLLVFDDPFPLTFSSNGFGVSGAPRQPKRGGSNPMLGGAGGAPPEQKADGGRATRLLETLGVRWEYDNCVFDLNNPHPEFAMLPAEYVFLTRSNAEQPAFSQADAVASGLQEMIALYPGKVEDSGKDGYIFEPLVKTSSQSGTMSWNEFVDEGGLNFFTMQATANPRRNPVRRLDGGEHSIACRIRKTEGEQQVNAIYVADIDMISDFFFQERSMGNLSMKFDNVTFVLNAVDSLIGDETFIALRSRRPEHRTLVRVEEQTRGFLQAASEAERDADVKATAELATRREQLGKRAKEIQENEALDPIAKAQMLKQAQEAEQTRMSLAEAQIEKEKNETIQDIRGRTDERIASLENGIRIWAVWLPPIPALAVGAIVFVRRLRDERNTVIESRRRRAT